MATAAYCVYHLANVSENMFASTFGRWRSSVVGVTGVCDLPSHSNLFIYLFVMDTPHALDGYKVAILLTM